ncbi:MAG: hypothetical protein JXA44_01985 [Methanospirillaceae archaeon]|nr:hypothetical protein [Methanospirillaceae archaeon]
MLEKAGYIKRSRVKAVDSDGTMAEVYEVMVEGRYYLIRTSELKNAVFGRISARIENMRQNYQQYLTGMTGISQISSSGRALNFEFHDGARFTVSIYSLKAVMRSESSFAPVARLPTASSIRMQNHPVQGGQQRLATA